MKNNFMLLFFGFFLMLLSCAEDRNRSKITNNNSSEQNIQLYKRLNKSDIDSLLENNVLKSSLDTLSKKICENRDELMDLLTINHDKNDIGNGYDLFHSTLTIDSTGKRSTSSYVVKRTTKLFYVNNRNIEELNKSESLINQEDYDAVMKVHRQLISIGIYMISEEFEDSKIKGLFLNDNKGIIFFISDTGYVSRNYQYINELLESVKICDNLYCYGR
ncbi:MAG: hypothetical protein R2799_01890 [Crocinitomicaceae bacterium]